jgi:hypothetical protein
MRRRLSNFATIASLLGFVIAIAAYGRSQFALETVGLASWDPRTRAAASWEVAIGEGHLHITRSVLRYNEGEDTAVYDRLPSPRVERYTFPPLTRPELRDDWALFAWYPPETRVLPAASSYGWKFGVHLLLVTAAAAVLPAARVRRVLHVRRAKRNGLCTTCGYDMRSTPERCPECGTVPAAKAEPPHNPPMQRTATAGSGAVE